MTGSSEQHRRAAKASAQRAVSCAVLTVSDTRTMETDEGGALVVELLEDAGHAVAERAIVRDDAMQIGAWLDDRILSPGVQAILTTGGTGIARRDTTIEVVRARLGVELEGFGELFRMLSWGQVGAAAMLSRAVAGLAFAPDDALRARPTLVFAMPGSVNAVETAMVNLVAPELSHLAWELRK